MMKKAIKTVSGIALVTGIGLLSMSALVQTAACADCDAVNPAGIKKAFEAFYDNCKKQLGDENQQKSACFAPNTYNKVLPIMKALSKDNRFGPGNRFLLIGETQNDMLTSGATRGFLSVAPLDRETLTVEINKIDSAGGALIRICLVDESGTVRRIGSIKFEDTSGTVSKTAALSGVRGKMIRVDIAGFGGPLKKFQYTLRAA